MKKSFLFPVMAMVVASCVQTETIAPELTEAEKEIKFQTVVAKQGTRAIITGVDYDVHCPSFGTYAFKNPTGSLPGSEVYITNEEIVHKDDGTTHYWGPETESYQWPKQGSLTFYSYSPYKYQEEAHKTTQLAPLPPEIGQYGFRFVNYDVDAHQETDLMVADIQYGQIANAPNIGALGSLVVHTGVKTVFKHKLALIGGFILSTSEDYDGNWDGVTIGTAKDGNLRFRILNITFKNIPTKGTFTSEGIMGTDATIIEEKWELSATPVLKDYVWYDNEDAEKPGGEEFGHVLSKQLHLYKPDSPLSGHRQADPTIDNGYLLAIPQQFLTGNEAALEITYTIENFSSGEWHGAEDKITKAVKLSDIHGGTPDLGWAMNKKIIYKLAFSTQEIRWAPYVENWENGDFTIGY